jgi:3-oxoacyl-[acyl-carrier-protein] synthase-3
MMTITAGIRSLSLYFPSVVRTNDFYRKNFPQMVEAAEKKALASPWNIDQTTPTSKIFDEELGRYYHDPFRGTIERRIMGDNESGLTMETLAATEALQIADIPPSKIDGAIVVSFPADQPLVGNGAFLARNLGLTCAAWNLESACSGSLRAIENACALVESGRYNNLLVVTSCAYSRVFDDASVLSWSNGDGASAVLVTREQPGFGLLGYHGLNTADSCGAIYAQMVVDASGQPKVRVGADRHLGKALRRSLELNVKVCCEGAIAKAGLQLGDIDFFIFNTPIISFSAFATRVLGVPQNKTVNAFPYIGNAGPVLTTANLYLAAQSGKIRQGDRVVVFSVGSSSSVGAAVFRWGDVTLGKQPDNFVELCTKSHAKACAE